MCMRVWCIHECWCPWRPEDGVGFPEAKVIGGCQPSDMDAGNSGPLPSLQPYFPLFVIAILIGMKWGPILLFVSLTEFSFL